MISAGLKSNQTIDILEIGEVGQLIPTTKLIRKKIKKLIRGFQLSLGGNTW